MVTSEKHQKSLLGGLERFLGVDHPDLIPLVPKVLMEFYQIDVLDEEVIKQWGTHVSRKYVDKETSKKVRKASEPFLKVRRLHRLSCDFSVDRLSLSGSTRQMTMGMMMETTNRLVLTVQNDTSLSFSFLVMSEYMYLLFSFKKQPGFSDGGRIVTPNHFHRFKVAQRSRTSPHSVDVQAEALGGHPGAAFVAIFVAAI